MATNNRKNKRPALRKPAKPVSKARGTVTSRRSGLSGFFQKLGKKRSVIAFVVVFASAGSIFLWVTNAQSATPTTARTWDTYAYGLRSCESGNRYTINTGNGFYGAYQFDYGTWQGIPTSVRGTASRADLASSTYQNRAAYYVYLTRGWGPWPSCGSHLSYSNPCSHTADTGGYGPGPSGCSGTSGGNPTPPPPTPVTCHAVGTHYGTGYSCGFAGHTPVYQGNTRVDYFYGSPDWVLCQEPSKTFYRSSSIYNVYWGYTLGDNGHWGWVNATYTTSGGNNGKFGGGTPYCTTAHITTSKAGAVPTLTHP